MASSCSGNRETPFVEYTGPIVESENITTYWSDSARVRVELNAARQMEFKEGNQEFPEGVEVIFYKKNGEVESVLTANEGYYLSEESLYRVVGNVVLKNEVNNETLSTEELFWDPKKEEVYTDRFVRIEREGQLIRGSKLRAPQDFSSFTLEKTEGIINLDEAGNETVVFENDSI